MALRIEDYAIIGDLHTAGLVGRDGSIDWLCFPRFDSEACFAALIGTEDNGFWRLAPEHGALADRRSYRQDTLVLEQEWDTPTGTVRIIDLMPQGDRQHDVVRIVQGVSGRVEMTSTLRLRFDLGRIVPWVHRHDGQVVAIAGPDAVALAADVPMEGRDLTTYSEFVVEAGDEIAFVLTWFPSHRRLPAPTDARAALHSTEKMWRRWAAQCHYDGPYREAVVRSLITLKALAYEPTGGIVAAPTTSLPESPGGVRNWDYRYCWLRDAAFTLDALVRGGYLEEATAWRDWLLRAIGGDPGQLQIMYGVAGERRLAEYEADWLKGYEGSRPVRIGNAASEQLQLDVYGEVLDALSRGRANGMRNFESAWSLQKMLLGHLETIWHLPDQGIWEVRGPQRHFVHSKVLAWVAFDRMVRSAEENGERGADVQRWVTVRDAIHADVCAHGYDAERNTFVQSYGSKELDAALLQLPLVGFLPPDDPRIVGTVDAVCAELRTDHGLLRRYLQGQEQEQNLDHVDGLPGGEGSFLACSFWLVEALHVIGREKEAVELFERLLYLRNDVGLLAEEYDLDAHRMLGNFPQAFSHVALVTSAYLLSDMPGPGTGKA